MHFDINESNLLYKIIGGSHLYGTNGPDSDIDYRGICIPTLEVAWGVSYNFDTKISHSEEEDVEIHALAKFTTLAMGANPNILEILFAPEDKVVHVDSCFKPYINNRELFISKKAYYSYAGYGFAQLKRIKNHRRYLLNPLTIKPEREAFNLPLNNKSFDATFINSILTLNEDQVKALGLPDNLYELLMREKQYLLAKREWDQYKNWEVNRNKARAELEAKYHYDTKHASHLIRLLRMAKEIGEKGLIQPDRRGIDADYLKAIRFNGALTYDQLIQEAETLEKESKEAFDKSTLRNSVDISAINDLYLQVCFNKYNIDYTYNLQL